MRKILLGIIMALSAITWFACDSGGGSTGVERSDADDVASAKALLEIGYQNGDSSSHVTGDITLTNDGSYNVSVTWNSNMQSVVSNSGLVTRPAYNDVNVDITIVATLTKGQESDSKSFTLTVIKEDPSFSVLNDWTNLAGINSTQCVTVDGDSIYAGTLSSGLVYSDDGGSTWSILDTDDDLSNNQVNAITISGSLVYIGTFQGLTVWDRGSVETIVNYLPTNTVRDILIENGVLFLASSSSMNDEDGIYYGSDIGSGLTYKETSLDSTNYLAVDEGSLYVSGTTTSDNSAEILKYNLSDINANPVELDLITGAPSFSTGPVFARGNKIVASANSYPYISINGGISFQYNLDTGGGAVSAYAGTEALLFCVKYGSDLWYSSDMGQNWDSYSIENYDGFTGINAKDLFISGSDLYIAHNSGLLKGTLQ